ncbi:MAG: alpha/beta hydrolase, partial [Cyanobacteria bacterium J06648_11]
LMNIRLVILAATSTYQLLSCWLEDRQEPPGQFVDGGGYCLHYCDLGAGSLTIVLDHSLGGREGYLLARQLATRSRVII